MILLWKVLVNTFKRGVKKHKGCDRILHFVLSSEAGNSSRSKRTHTRQNLCWIGSISQNSSVRQTQICTGDKIYVGWDQILGTSPTIRPVDWGSYSTRGFPAEKNVPSQPFKLNMRRRNHHHHIKGQNVSLPTCTKWCFSCGIFANFLSGWICV